MGIAWCCTGLCNGSLGISAGLWKRKHRLYLLFRKTLTFLKIKLLNLLEKISFETVSELNTGIFYTTTNKNPFFKAATKPPLNGKLWVGLTVLVIGAAHK